MKTLRQTVLTKICGFNVHSSVFFMVYEGGVFKKCVARPWRSRGTRVIQCMRNYKSISIDKFQFFSEGVLGEQNYLNFCLDRCSYYWLDYWMTIVSLLLHGRGHKLFEHPSYDHRWTFCYVYFVILNFIITSICIPDGTIPSYYYCYVKYEKHKKPHMNIYMKSSVPKQLTSILHVPHL